MDKSKRSGLQNSCPKYDDYLVEEEQHMVAEFAGAEEPPLLGDLQAAGHRNGVEHLQDDTWLRSNSGIIT